MKNFKFLWSGAALRGAGILVLVLVLTVTACDDSIGGTGPTVTTVTTVTVSPTTATVAKGGTQSFTAAVAGTNNPAQTVTWSVEGAAVSGTTITTGGVLTVAANETATSLTIRATSTVDTGKSGTAIVTVSANTVTVTGVTVSPAAVTVAKGGTQTFIATVAGTNNPAQTVTWSVEGAAVSGTMITTGGVLTVAAGETATSLTVRAASTVDTSKSGTATVTVSAPASTVTGVTVSPAAATVAKGDTQTFTAAVAGTNSPAQTVTWSVEGAAVSGTTITTGGVLTVAAGETATSLTVRAASTVDTGKSGTAVVTVSAVGPTVTGVTVSPAAATASKSGTQNFTATVAGTDSPAQTVTWSVEGAALPGTTISPAGVLTVAAGETATSLTIRAASTVDTGKSGTAAVTVIGSRDMVQVNSVSVTITGDSAYNPGVFPAGRVVTLSPFKIAKYEITYELWYEVRTWAAGHGYTIVNPGREGNDGDDGAEPTTAKNKPVTKINWRDAVIWCNAYSEMTGKTPVYRNASDTIQRSSVGSMNVDATKWAGKNGYRLPTEAEWEYAARGGGTPNTTGPFVYTYAGSNNIWEVAWYRSYTHTVGERAANGLGLHDMSGNVSEWCWDWYNNSVGTGSAADPSGPMSGTKRVLRGGGSDCDASECAVARPYSDTPDSAYNYYGFRVVCLP